MDVTLCKKSELETKYNVPSHYDEETEIITERWKDKDLQRKRDDYVCVFESVLDVRKW